MRLANEAIRRVRHPIPTVNDVSFALNGAKFFSKLDLSQAYHQLELDEQSRYITTFSTHVFSKEGTHPDPRRVAGLLNAPQPNNAHEVRSFLGMANYSSKYIRDSATLTAPLRDLTKKDLKNTLAIAPCMSYFDKNKQTFVTVDASPVGISGILSQKPRNGDVDSQQIIAYATQALTDTEKRYSLTEKEALAIVWAVEHFHLFLFGSEFTLITDHKPLEIIYGQRTAKTSARIER
ncbi:Hypothetical predicted protein [Paramuricea clavata]|uniref:Uncharacterized protein n=1 Tax=Paramuricea clavata TaxID=317549 RepID=A0A7D9L658_PARCT|nr:Hypothetical predicted protein [Paramuricea clavata]